jgi:hypothetical protein
MADEGPGEQRRGEGEFAREAEAAPAGLLREFWDFARQNKKLWLLPVIGFLLLIGAFAILGGTVAAPFIYTLF